MAKEIAKRPGMAPTKDEFVGEGGYSGAQLAGVAMITVILVLIGLYLASPNVNPH
ncbi:MAG TPA: hypothetical protein VF407_12765 [Polyangiaceae bacterium]